MDFGWTVTDNTHTKPVDPFRGYFTDIQRAARKSLPKKPSKELCGLLGLKHVPSDAEKGGSFVTLPTSATNIGEQSVIPRGSLVPAVASEDPKQSVFDKTLSVLPCSESLAGLSKRERTIVALVIYFAAIILILLVIVVILAATLSSQSQPDANGEGVILASSGALVTSTAASSFTTTPRVSSPLNTPVSTKSTRVTNSNSDRPSTTTQSQTVKTSPNLPSTTPTRETSSNSDQPPITTSSKVQTTKTSRKLPSTTPTPAVTTLSTPPPTTNLQTNSTKLPSTTTSTNVTQSSGKITRTRTPKPSTSPIPTTTTTSRRTPPNPSKATSKPTLQTTHKTTSNKPSTPPSTALTSRSTRPPTSTERPTSPTAPHSTTLNPALLPKLAAQTVKTTCSSRDCQSARETISKVDFDTSPCLDFYQFACGRWIETRKASLQNEPDGPQSTEEELRQILFNQVKDLLSVSYASVDSFAAKVSRRLYQSCLESNQDRDKAKALQELHQAVDVLGMTPAGNMAGTALYNLLYLANTRFGVTPFFQMAVTPISTDSGHSVYGLKVRPPTLPLASSIYNTPVEINEPAGDYISALTNIFYSYILSFPVVGDRANYTTIYNSVLRAYYVEANISKLLEEYSGSGSSQFEIVQEGTVAELVRTVSNIPWEGALGVQDPQNGAKVLLVYPDYFQKLDELLGQLPTDDVMMYVFMSTLTQGIWRYMPLEFRQSLKSGGMDIPVAYSDMDCVDKSLELAREEIHGLYVTTHTQKVLDTRIQLTNLDDTINLAFQDLITDSAWMQSSLKRVVSIFLTNMRIQFSTVSYDIKSTAGITDGAQTFLSLALELHRQVQAVNVGRLTTNVTVENSMDWTSTLVTYDSQFIMLGLPTALAVYFPNGNEPVFDLHGRIGKVMTDQVLKVLTGELTRGVAPAWWGPDNINAFNAVATCFADQQSSLQMSNYEVGNIMLDNGGLELIKEAYLSSSRDVNATIPGTSMTQAMMFYLNTVQLHCRVDESSLEHRLLRQRLNNMAMNKEGLETLFNCPAGSPLVTQDTCTLV